MRKLLLFILFSSVGIAAGAQDVDLDKFYFKTQEILFPKNLLPAEKRTYKYTGHNIDTIDFNENNAIVLNGFKKDDNGTVEVISGYAFGLKWAEQKTNVRQDINTKANFYSISVVAVCSGRITVECKEIDFKHYDLSSFRKTYATKEFNSEREAQNEFALLQKSWRDDSKINFQKFVVQETNYRANIAFGYAAHNWKIKLWLLGSKDHPEYANMQQQFTAIKNAFAEVKQSGIPQDMNTKLAPVIAYFEGLPKQYAEDNKKHKKMRYAAYYTLMKLYYHTDDLTNAEKYANLLITNDYDGKDGKNMLEAIKERKALWEANKAASSHFDVGGETGANIYSQE